MPCWCLARMFAIPNRVFPRRFASVTADKSCWTASAMRCTRLPETNICKSPTFQTLHLWLLRSSVGRRKKLPRATACLANKAQTFWCLKAMQRSGSTTSTQLIAQKCWLTSTTRSSIPRSPSCLQRGLLFRCSSVGPSLYSLVSNYYYYYCIGPPGVAR